MPKNLMAMHGDQRHVLELCAIFLTAPLAAKGLPIARAVADTLVPAVMVIVVMPSHR